MERERDKRTNQIWSTKRMTEMRTSIRRGQLKSEQDKKRTMRGTGYRG